MSMPFVVAIKIRNPQKGASYAMKTISINDNLHRVINSRWPPIGLFDDLVDNEQELRLLFNLEMATNGRLNPAISRLSAIPKGEIVQDPGAHLVMAAFVHCHDQGGRFNDGHLGAWYAATTIECAIEETSYHLTKRLSLSQDAFPQYMQMRQLITTINQPIVDLQDKNQYPQYYLSDDYQHSQAFAKSIRWPYAKQGTLGICYSSVRYQQGTNVCIFKPAVINRPITQGATYLYQWDKNGKLYVDKTINIKS